MKKIIIGLFLISSAPAFARIPGVNFPSNSKSEISQTGKLFYEESGCFTFTEENTSSIILDQLIGFVEIKAMRNNSDMICAAKIQEFENEAGKFHIAGKVQRIRSGVSSLVNDVFEVGSSGIYNNKPNGTIFFDLDSNGLISNIIRNH